MKILNFWGLLDSSPSLVFLIQEEGAALFFASLGVWNSWLSHLYAWRPATTEGSYIVFLLQHEFDSISFAQAWRFLPLSLFSVTLIVLQGCGIFLGTVPIMRPADPRPRSRRHQHVAQSAGSKDFNLEGSVSEPQSDWRDST